MYKSNLATNPHFSGSATLEDIKPGTALLRVFPSSHIDAVVVESLPVESQRIHFATRQTALCLFPPRSGGHDQWFLDRCGVVPYPDGYWVDDCVTIVNTESNRERVLQWLLEEDSRGVYRTAGALILRYPDQPVADHTLRKLIAGLMKF